MIDLTLSPRLANPQAQVGVMRALGGSSAAWTGRVEGGLECTSPSPAGGVHRTQPRRAPTPMEGGFIRKCFVQRPRQMTIGLARRARAQESWIAASSAV